MIILLNILDLAVTYIGGIQNEANPFAAFALRYGIFGAIIFKLLVLVQYRISVLILWRLNRHLIRYFRTGYVGIYLFVIIWNIFYIGVMANVI